jgi:hypothetical protein
MYGIRLTLTASGKETSGMSLLVEHQRAPAKLVECPAVNAVTAVASTAFGAQLVCELLYISVS